MTVKKHLIQMVKMAKKEGQGHEFITNNLSMTESFKKELIEIYKNYKPKKTNK